MSNQECELGVWKATHDVRVRMGVSAFTLPRGASVLVTQIDYEYNNVLVDAGSRTTDWMPMSWLINNFEFVV